MSCDEHIEIFNKLMNARSYAFNWFEKKILKSFKNSYMFKRGGMLSTLDIFKPKGNVKCSRLVFTVFNIKDLKANPFQEGVLDVEQTTKSNAYT